jgi:hypothetical protein
VNAAIGTDALADKPPATSMPPSVVVVASCSCAVADLLRSDYRDRKRCGWTPVSNNAG